MIQENAPLNGNQLNMEFLKAPYVFPYFSYYVLMILPNVVYDIYLIQGSILGPLLFLICINDLPKILNDYSVPILFADDTSVLKSSNPTEFQTNVVNTFNCAYKWFQINLLTINIKKTIIPNLKLKTNLQKI